MTEVVAYIERITRSGMRADSLPPDVGRLTATPDDPRLVVAPMISKPEIHRGVTP